jgi:hypothetical protein
MKRTFPEQGVALGALSLALAGLLSCGPPPPAGVVYVERRPPPVRVEVLGPAPGPGYVRIDGYWRWGGADFTWVPGRWEQVDGGRGHRKWERGRWKHHGNQWYWIEGHWR